MEKNIIDEAKSIIDKSKSLKDKYFRISKTELYKPEEVSTMSAVEYKKLYNMDGVKDFNDANEEFKKAKEIQEKINSLEKMVAALNSMYDKRSRWQRYTMYRTVVIHMREILKNYVKELGKELEEKAKQVKDGNVDVLN